QTLLSHLKIGWRPKALKILARQTDLVTDYLESYREELLAPGEPFGARMLLWCLANRVPLRQFGEGGMKVVFYEDLCRRPAEILPDLFEHIGVRYSRRVLSTLRVPSRTT